MPEAAVEREHGGPRPSPGRADGTVLIPGTLSPLNAAADDFRIAKPDDFLDLVARIRDSGAGFAFDVETSSTRLEVASIVGLSISSRTLDVYFPLRHRDPLLPPKEEPPPPPPPADEPFVLSGAARKRERKPPAPKPRRRTLGEQRATPPYVGNLPERELLAALLDLFRASPATKGAHNIAFDWRALLEAWKRLGLVDTPFLAPGLNDSMLAAYALSLHLREAHGRLGLDWLAERVLGRNKDEAELRAWFEKQGVRRVQDQKESLAWAPIRLAARYCVFDARLCRGLLKRLLRKLREDTGCRRVYARELRLARTTMAMESTPKFVDLAYAEERLAASEKELEVVKVRAEKIAKRDLNMNSAKQLAEVLRLRGLPLPLTEKSEAASEDGEGGTYSTSAEALEPFRNKDALVEAIFDHRWLKRRKDVFEALVAYSIPCRWRSEGPPESGRVFLMEEEDASPAARDWFRRRRGILFPHLNQTSARTGRFSTSEPNLHGTDRDDTVDEELVDRARAWSVRRAIVPPGPNWLLLFVDWRQVEPRLTAHFTRDRNLAAIFAENRDLYVEIGKTAWPVDLELPDKAWKEAHPDLRQRAKNLFLAVEYGAGPRQASVMIGPPCGTVEAALILQRVDERFPGIGAYAEYLARQFRARGYVRNPFGRKLYLDHEERTYALLNYMVQGTGADLLKVATIRADDDLAASGLRATLAMSSHDELFLHVHREDVEEAIPILVRAMTDFPFRVPLEVEVAIASVAWSEKVPVPIGGPFPWDKLP